MSFDLDDPLAGILSDGSDDSFFDDDILGKKKPQKKEVPVTEKKKSLFNLEDDKPKPKLDERKSSLFDLGETKKFDPSTESKIATETKSKIEPSFSPSPKTIRRTVSKDSIKNAIAEENLKPILESSELKSLPKPRVGSKSAESLDIFADFGLDKKKEPAKPLQKGKSSQSLFDDILGPPKTGSSSQTRPATSAISEDLDSNLVYGKTESKQPIKPKPLQKQSSKPEVKKDVQPITKKKTADDWLGIFGDKDENVDVTETDVPPWLAGDKKTTENSKQHTKEVVKEPEVVKKDPVPEIEPLTQINIGNQIMPEIKDVAAESATLYMQQQESQLMVALQLKAQEERLASMYMRQKETERVQKEATQASHQQLENLLKRQAEQRRQMQDIITAHQERITQRIKALLSPYSLEATENDQEEAIGAEFKTDESPHGKEKRQLLQLVQSLQENHDKEIDLMETSYRRQLAFLEISSNHAEERMKEETERLLAFYKEKINWLEDHHNLYKKLSEENLNSLSERHKTESEMLNQHHLDSVKVLQEYHQGLLENIKNAVKQEQNLIKDSTEFSTDLQTLIEGVKEVKTECQELVDNVRNVNGNIKDEAERSLEMRERQISEMIQQLKNERDNFKTEKTESRETIKILESRLKQMTVTIEEETVALKQKKMEFDFEKAAFDKQTEFAKNVLKRQDEEMKALREDMQKDHQNKVNMIEEEKSKVLKDSAIIVKEKASVQRIRQELEKMKAELEAQLEEATEERSKLGLEKQQLHMEEQRLVAKSRDIELLAKTAIEKQSQADKKIADAELSQRTYEEKLKKIQEQVISLNLREKQIAKEKISLSRERVYLHSERKEMEKQQCSLCRSSQNVPKYNFNPNTAFPEGFTPIKRQYSYAENLNVVSKERFDDGILNQGSRYVGLPESSLSRGGNVSTAMNAMENEMAQLLGRSFGLKHSPELRNEEKLASLENNAQDGPFKDFLDPKLMMLRLDVQKVISNLEHQKDDGNVEAKEGED